MVLVDRGNCSFVTKAFAAQAAGAIGLIVRGTKRAVYEAIMSNRTTNSSTYLIKHDAEFNGINVAVENKPVFEYDCSKGVAFVDELAIPVWNTDAKKCSEDVRCSSRSCVLTGHTMMQGSSTKHQVCCMWDTFVIMGAMNETGVAKLAIPVVYVTINDGQELQNAIVKYPTSLVARTYQRERPLIDVSSILLWALGVATALGATYYSTRDLRHRNEWDAAFRDQKERGDQDQVSLTYGRDDVYELNARHAVGFMALAGVVLIGLYYAKIGGVIPVLFAVSGAVTLAQVVGTPLMEWLVPSIASRELPIPLSGGTASVSECLGFLPSIAVAVVWYLHRRTYWVLQDLMGISLCFLFLRTVQLPNLKVATVLLTLAFAYDVFFVFLSPIFFGSSVMVDVASGGPAAYTKSGYPGVDYCERYPTYSACVDPEPMPMLLVMPRIMNWAGGVSMLGLGDIIMPGMLHSFAQRYDYARGGTKNYFRMMAIGYAVGLALANLAVMITSMGQPALMYIVPSTLGPLIIASKRNGDFRAMWSGAVGFESTTRSSYDGPEYSAVSLVGP